MVLGHRSYAHARKLRETPTRHLYPLPFAKREAGRQPSGRCVYPSAELDIHVVRKRERLTTETTEETDTRVPALCSIHA